MYIKKLKIRNLELNNNLMLAPMAGVTDMPFRMICKKYGNPGLLCNEMVSSKAICYKDDKTLKMLDFDEIERPISRQIFGSDASIMGEAARYVEKYADVIDINMGCPAPKVVKNGDGSRLLLDLPNIKRIIETVRKSTEKPLTVKIRKGWDKEHIVAVEVAKIAEEAGADAIVVHGRTRDEFYTGTSDWNILKQVKDAVKIPVIGNGDVKSPEDAKKMFDETGVDGIMIGRACLGNPWLFREITEYLSSFDNNTPFEKTVISPDEKKAVMKEHFELLLKQKGEYTATREIRKHIAWYSKGLKDSSCLREQTNKVETAEDFYRIIDEYFEKIISEQ